MLACFSFPQSNNPILLSRAHRDYTACFSPTAPSLPLLQGQICHGNLPTNTLGFMRSQRLCGILQHKVHCGLFLKILCYHGTTSFTLLLLFCYGQLRSVCTVEREQCSYVFEFKSVTGFIFLVRCVALVSVAQSLFYLSPKMKRSWLKGWMQERGF